MAIQETLSEGLMQVKVGGIGLGSTKSIVAGVGAVGLVGGTIAKANFVTTIPEGYRGLRLSLGRAKRTSDAWFGTAQKGDYYGYYEPGKLKFTWPFTHSILKICIQGENTNLDDIQVRSKKGQQYDVSSAMNWNVKQDVDSLYKAAYNVSTNSTLDRTVVDIASSGLRSVMEGLGAKKMMSTAEVQGSLQEVITAPLEEYGVQMNAWYSKTITPTGPEIIGRYMIEAARAGNGNALFVPVEMDEPQAAGPGLQAV